MMYKVKIYKNEKYEQFDSKNDILVAEQAMMIGDDFTLEEIKQSLIGISDKLIKEMKEVKK